MKAVVKFFLPIFLNVMLFSALAWDQFLVEPCGHITNPTAYCAVYTGERVR